MVHQNNEPFKAMERFKRHLVGAAPSSTDPLVKFGAAGAIKKYFFPCAEGYFLNHKRKCEKSYRR